MIINIGHNYRIEWNGGHYLNYFDDENVNYHCISFCWDKDKPTQLDALNAFVRYEREDVA